MNTRKIIIDTDPGHDDMLAILLLCAAPSIEVCALTTVAGNSTIQNVTNNARFILELAGKADIPLHSGASTPLERKPIFAVVHGESGLDGVRVPTIQPLDENAVAAILNIVRSNPGEISLLILGPQTNIAQAILKDPETMKWVREFVIMGGAFNVPGNKNRVAEFNICVDPEAAAIVAAFPVRKTYIPLDVCNGIQIPLSEFSKINNRRVREVLSAAMQPYIENIQKDELATKGALMYDALAAYFIIRPEGCDVKDAALVIETKGEFTYGMTLVDNRPFSKKEPNNAKIVTAIPERQFVKDFFAILNG